jgi:hypothetical protein
MCNCGWSEYKWKQTLPTPRGSNISHMYGDNTLVSNIQLHAKGHV